MDDDIRITKGNGQGAHGADSERPDAEDRLDLTALDPTADAERFGHVVRRIGARAASELARRASADVSARARSFDQPAIAVVDVMRGWQRVLWPAAAAIALVSLATLGLVEYPTTEGVSAESQLAQALGVPASLAEWVAEGELPEPGLLVFSEEEQ